MSSTIQYKDYIGSVEFSQEDGVFYGKVLGIRALISYEGTNAKELIADFEEAVEDYLNMCTEEKKEPERAYKGSFNLRISPNLHRTLAVQAIAEDISLNSYVERMLQKAIANS